MGRIVLPALFALAVWWFSTGAILFLDRLPRWTFRWSLLAASALAAIALAGLAWAGGHATPTGAYAAFSCAIIVWGWQELGFLTGLVTGPRRTGCHQRCAGWAHLGHAVLAVLYHELALAACGVAVWLVTSGEANTIGLQTFLVLWVLRMSAKFNLYLGVPNLNEEMLPDHLRYLESYLVRKPMNALFPLSITAGTALSVMLWQAAIAPAASDFEAVGASLLAALATLAVLEHWFMVLPLPSAALWSSWGLGLEGIGGRQQAPVVTKTIGHVH